MTLAAGQRRTLVLALAACSYAATFIAFLVFERPGLGIANFYLLGIVLLALATGPRAGAAGGVLATMLFGLGVYINPHVPAVVAWASDSIRFVTYVGMGVLVGWYAGSKRDLVAELERLARRDELTGLPNTRSFEAAIERRFEAGNPFALLLGDVDSLGAVNGRGGWDAGDEELRRLAELLGRAQRPGDEVARVGGDEFAVLAATDGDARELALRIERLLAASGADVTFGWAQFPREGRNALALYRAADERLYARKLARGYRRGSGSLERAVARSEG